MKPNRIELVTSLFRALCVFYFTVLVQRGALEFDLYLFPRNTVLYLVFVVYVLGAVFAPSGGMMVFVNTWIDTALLFALVGATGFSGNPLSVFAPLLALSAYFRLTPGFAAVYTAFLAAAFFLVPVHEGGFSLFRETSLALLFPLVFLATRFSHQGLEKLKYRQMYLDLEKESHELQDQVRMLEEKLQTHTIIDPVTGLKNFRYFRSRIEEEVERSARHGRPFSMCICEVDDFGDFQRAWGAREAELALQKIARCLTRVVRNTDLVGRYSGDRFILLFLESDARSSLVPALRVKQAAEKLALGPDANVRLTLCQGISSFPQDVKEVGGLISLASRALDRSKKKGRGKITLASSLWKMTG
ncbi:MAG: GGDEF domain-containing protein [bacterium]